MVKKYQDEIVPQGGRVYQIEDIPNGDTCHILDVTEYTQVGAEFHAADVNAACLLEANHQKVNTVHQITTPNTATENIKFIATAAYARGDTFTLNGVELTAKMLNGKPLADGHFGQGAMVTCLLANNVLWFEGGCGAVLVDDTTGVAYRLGINNGKLYIKEDE